MSRLVVEFLDQGFHRMLFDAMPMPVFVVDEDVTILEYNTAASKLLAKGRQEWLGRRSDHVLHCVHSEDVAEGCGHGPACLDCVLRESVRCQPRAKGEPKADADGISDQRQTHALEPARHLPPVQI